MVTRKSITQYRVIVTDATTDISTCILLFSDQYLAGRIFCIKQGIQVRKPRNRDGVIEMDIQISRLHTILDILRNEKPLFICFERGQASLETGEEPIGEEEKIMIYKSMPLSP